MRKKGHYKKFEKAKKAVDGDEDDLMLCSLMRASKTKENKKVWFAEDVKQSSEAGVICTIDGNTFFLFTKHTGIGDSGASCHITNGDTGLYDVMILTNRSKVASV